MIAEQIRVAGSFAIDLEFISQGRYIPELALVQLAWSEPNDPHPEQPRVALVDPLAVDPRPVLALVAEPAIETIAHAATQDLALLAYRFDLRAAGFWDTQIAAAFTGLGTGLGYGRLIEATCGIRLDKGPQWTDWLRRPLSAEQLRYAVDDVRFLPSVWRSLRRELEQLGRIAWVCDECSAAAVEAARRDPPALAYRRVGGWNGLDGPALGALCAAAAWRESQALARNRPPQKILADRVLLSLAERRPDSVAGLRKLTGNRELDEAALAELATGITAGAGNPPAPERGRKAGLSARAQALAQVFLAIVQLRAVEQNLPLRYLGTRADAEELAAWCEAGRPETVVPVLLAGWRRQAVGETLLSWLGGELALCADLKSELGLRLRPS